MLLLNAVDYIYVYCLFVGYLCAVNFVVLFSRCVGGLLDLLCDLLV